MQTLFGGHSKIQTLFGGHSKLQTLFGGQRKIQTLCLFEIKVCARLGPQSKIQTST